MESMEAIESIETVDSVDSIDSKDSTDSVNSILVPNKRPPTFTPQCWRGRSERSPCVSIDSIDSKRVYIVFVVLAIMTFVSEWK